MMKMVFSNGQYRPPMHRQFMPAVNQAPAPAPMSAPAPMQSKNTALRSVNASPLFNMNANMKVKKTGCRSCSGVR